MISKIITLAVMLSIANSSVHASCIDYGIIEVNAKKGKKKALTTTAIAGGAGTLAATYITSSVAVAKSAKIGASNIAIGSSALLATSVIAGAAAVGVTTYLIKRSKNTNTDLLEFSHQVVSGKINANDLSALNSLIDNSHISYGRHLRKFLELKEDLNLRLGTELNVKDLAELIIYVDSNLHVKNSEKVIADKKIDLVGINPFCAFSKTKFNFKEFKFKHQLVRRTYKHEKLLDILEYAYNLKKNNASNDIQTVM